MGNTLPKLHQVIGITYNNSPNAIHGRIITSSDAYHKATEWFLHHMKSVVLFRRYIRSLDTLELSVFIAFLLLITIGKVCMFKFETSLLGVNNVRVRTSFSSQQLTFFPLPIQGMFHCWSCDLIRKLPQTSRDNVYITIMIEHFSKWVELVTLPNKSSHSTS
jgi:hypothetical protein